MTIRTDYNPKHYRFARTWRDSNGGENLAPLPSRVTFRHHHGPQLRHVLILVPVVVCFLAGWGVR